MVKQLRDALVWLPVWERDKRAFIPEVCAHQSVNIGVFTRQEGFTFVLTRGALIHFPESEAPLEDGHSGEPHFT